ncbi:MAG: hypothetical protein ACLQU1_20055 [Bryobacteraceae bacterium]
MLLVLVGSLVALVIDGVGVSPGGAASPIAARRPCGPLDRTSRRFHPRRGGRRPRDRKPRTSIRAAAGWWTALRSPTAAGGPRRAPGGADDAGAEAHGESLPGATAGRQAELVFAVRPCDRPLSMFVFLNLHDCAATVNLLQQSLRNREPDLVALSLDPIFDPIRTDAPIAAILRELNLAE